MFNTILLEGEFPKSWNRGYIVPLHKSGNARDPNNYRGLTINSCLSNEFTSILNERLQKYLHVNDIINKYQIGLACFYLLTLASFYLLTLASRGPLPCVFGVKCKSCSAGTSISLSLLKLDLYDKNNLQIN